MDKKYKYSAGNESVKFNNQLKKKLTEIKIKPNIKLQK